LKNEELQERINDQQALLVCILKKDSYVNLDHFKQLPQIPKFEPGVLAIPLPAPIEASYLPLDLTFWQSLVPGAKDKHVHNVSAAAQRFAVDFKKFVESEAKRKTDLAKAQAGYERDVEKIRASIDAQNAELEKLKSDFARRDADAVTQYFSLVLESSSYPDGFAPNPRVAYVAESKQLVLEYELPSFDVVPAVGSYKYVRARDEVTEIARPVAQRRAIYSEIIAQVTLRTLHELCTADRADYLESVVFNGYVNSIDKGTGHKVRPCIVTLRTSKETFTQLELGQVDPAACLKSLNASVSKSPSELVPVRPVLEFRMVDPRFVKEVDILSELDQRPNLMELNPREFETLITNLFGKMGLEMRQTRPSRDGGVDCVAYDSRPIFGGKVIIQAKRYKNTVGVSAVRDLFGTMQNEGASKGILVTTSGYGKASFEFATNKPMELLSGSNLLFLLKEHAGMDAKIEPPEEWTDPVPDRGE
jgi:restriction system protein